MLHDGVPAPVLKDLLIIDHAMGSSKEASKIPSTHQGPDPLRVAIVGGSLGGCCAAIALSQAGCQVQIFERSAGLLQSQGAGLVIQPDMAGFLEEFHVCDVACISVCSSGRQYIDLHGNILQSNDTPQFFSAWDVLYRALRAAVPKSAYHAGCEVRAVGTSRFGHGASISLGNGKKFEVDMVVGADGPGSIVRRTFLPSLSTEYQGYIAWRGVVNEAQAPPNVLKFLGTRFTVYQGPNFHILTYIIPGEDGSVVPGRRRVNWVWYQNVRSEELNNIMVDVQGVTHKYSIARGALK